MRITPSYPSTIVCRYTFEPLSNAISMTPFTSLKKINFSSSINTLYCESVFNPSFAPSTLKVPILPLVSPDEPEPLTFLSNASMTSSTSTNRFTFNASISNAEYSKSYYVSLS